MKIIDHSFCNYKRISILQFKTNDCNSCNYDIGINKVRRSGVYFEEKFEGTVIASLDVKNSLNQILFFKDGDLFGSIEKYRIYNSVLIPPQDCINVPVFVVQFDIWHECLKGLFEIDDDSWDEDDSTIDTADDSMLDQNITNRSFVFRNPLLIRQQYMMFLHFFKLRSIMEERSIKFKKEISLFLNYIDQFRIIEGYNGLATFLDDKLFSIEIFNNSDVYKYYFPSVIISSLSEFYSLNNKNVDFKPEIAFNKVSDFLSRIFKIRWKEEYNPGIGEFKVCEDDHISGFMLMYEYRIIHLSVVFIQ